jgi:MFS family permease
MGAILASAPGAQVPPPNARAARRATLASTVGTVIEWYDFGLYAVAGGLVFPTEFFPQSDRVVGILSSFIVFAVGYIARPLGGLLFGHFGDRLGRKGALVATVMLMGVGTFLVAIVPNYQAIGLWGAVALCVLRFVQGVGVGGEWSGSILVAMEWSGEGKRGLAASWPQIGVPMGTVLANLAVVGASLATGDAFMTWGWRLPFALSLVLVGVGLWIRVGVQETPVFREVVRADAVSRRPVLDAIRTSWREILLTMFLRMSELASFVVFGVFVYTFTVQMMHYDRNLILAAVMLGLAVECLVVPFAGMLSDRIGRKRMFMIGAALSGLVGFAYFPGLASGSTAIVVLVVVLSFIPHGLQYGPEGALIAESFPAHLRYSGSSIGYQLASVLGASTAPFIATSLLTRDPSGNLVAVYLLICALISLAAAALLKRQVVGGTNGTEDVLPEGARQ